MDRRNEKDYLDVFKCTCATCAESNHLIIGLFYFIYLFIYFYLNIVLFYYILGKSAMHIFHIAIAHQCRCFIPC